MMQADRGSRPERQALLALAERELRAMLAGEGLPVRGTYRPGEVCQLLRISPTTLRDYCERAEHPASGHQDPRALQSFLVGTHHRITYAALVAWLAVNRPFER